MISTQYNKWLVSNQTEILWNSESDRKIGPDDPDRVITSC